MLPAGARVAMEYSPLNAIPYVSLVDAGTVDLSGHWVSRSSSSADLVQVAVLPVDRPSNGTIISEASQRLMEIKDRAFAEVARRIRSRT